MTAEMAPGQAGATPGGPTEPGPARPSAPQRSDDVIRYGIWLAVLVRSLADRRFQEKVITTAIGAFALAILIKKNQARAVRRAVAWWNVKGEIRDMQLLHHPPQAVQPGQREGVPCP